MIIFIERSLPSSLRWSRLPTVVLFAFATISIAEAMLGTSVAQAAGDPPQVGQCSLLDESSFASVHSLAWNDDRAAVAGPGMEVPARPIGLREFSGGFKLSLFYEDPITGPSEVVVFTMDIGQGRQYRMGSVSYDILPNGTRVLGSMSAFEDAICMLK